MDGRHVVAAGRDGRIQAWETDTGKALYAGAIGGLPGVRALAISPDARLLAVHGGNRLRLLDFHSGQEVINFDSIFRHPAPDNAYEPMLAWSGDGERLTASDYYRNVLVFDAAEMETPAAKRRLREEAEARAFGWHLTRGESCLDWQLLRPGLEEHARVVESGTPPDRSLRWQRAYLQARRGLWAKVAADLADVSPEDWHARPSLAMLQACACLQTGDVAGYRQRCARLQKEAGTEWNWETRLHLLQVCLLSADATEPKALLVLARNLRSTQPANDPEADHYLGLAHFRAGELDEAARLLESITTAHPNWNKAALNALTLAAIYQRQGKAAKAAEALGQTDAQLGVVDGKLPSAAPPRWTWTEWLQAHRLRAEATARTK